MRRALVIMLAVLMLTIAVLPEQCFRPLQAVGPVLRSRRLWMGLLLSTTFLLSIGFYWGLLP